MGRRSKTGGGTGTNQHGISGAARDLFHRRADPGTRRFIEQAVTSSPSDPDGIDVVKLPRPELVGWSTRKRHQLNRWLTIRRGDRDPYLPPAHYPTSSMATPGPSPAAGGTGGGGSGPNTPAPLAAGGDRPNEVAAMLHEHFADVEYTDEEMDAVFKYGRAKDRQDVWWYTRVNKFIRSRGTATERDAEQIARRLESALSKGSTPQDLTTYRGLEDLAPFGVTMGNAEQLVGQTKVLSGFQSTSVDPFVAAGFAGRKGSGAVLELRVPRWNRMRVVACGEPGGQAHRPGRTPSR